MIGFVSKFDFNRNVDKNFTLPSSYPESVCRVANAVIPFLNAHPVSRTALSGTFILIHLRELFRALPSKNETLTQEDRTKIQQSAFKICILALSIKFPYEHQLITTLIEIISSLSKCMKTSFNNAATKKEKVLAAIHLIQQMIYFLSISKESPDPALQKQQALLVWNVLSLALQSIRELITIFDMKKTPETASSLILLLTKILQALLHSLKIFPEIKANPLNFLKSLMVLSKLFLLSAMGVIKNSGENSPFSFLRNILHFSFSFTDTLNSYTQIPNTIFHAFNSIFDLFPEPAIRPYQDLAERREEATPLEEMPGWTRPKVETAAYLAAIRDPDRYDGLRPSKGLLLWGSPGTGKTTFARSFASSAEKQVTMIQGSLPLAQIQFIINQAPQGSIVIIDEISTCAQKREGADRETRRATDSFLTAVFDARNDLTIIGTTNELPSSLDAAFVRRFKPVEFTLPNRAERIALLEKFCQDVSWENAPLEQLADCTDGLSYHELKEAVNETAITARFRDTVCDFALFRELLVPIERPVPAPAAQLREPRRNPHLTQEQIRKMIYDRWKKNRRKHKRVVRVR